MSKSIEQTPSAERRKEVRALWRGTGAIGPPSSSVALASELEFYAFIAALDAQHAETLAKERASWEQYSAARIERLNQTIEEMKAKHASAIFDTNAQWRCFHCDEVFTSPTDARLHFGGSSADEPACKIKAAGEHALLKALRVAYAKLAEFNRGESDMAIAMQHAEDDHRRALKEAEQLGFDRGVESSRAEVAAMRNAVGTQAS
jgi:hypothetical protein